MKTVQNKHTYHLVGDVNPENIKAMSTWFREQASENSDNWLSLYITSGGGWVPGGFGFVDLLLSILKNPIQTVALGQTSSMAIPLFMIGKHRAISPHTILRFHEMDGGFENRSYPLTEVEEILNALKIQRRLYSQFVASRTDSMISEEKVLQLMREGARLTAQNAIELGLAHEILPQ